MDPLTASAVFTAGAGGASGGGMAAAMSNPITAAIAAAAAAAAYGTSPSVRKYVNKGTKSMYEKFTNPFQHFGDGTEGDKFGSFLSPYGLDNSMGGAKPQGLGSLMNNPVMQQFQQKFGQQKQQDQDQQQQRDRLFPFGNAFGGSPFPIPGGGSTPRLPDAPVTVQQSMPNGFFNPELMSKRQGLGSFYANNQYGGY